MDMETKGSLAIYVNLINVVDAFTNHQMDFIFSIRSYCKKKRYMKILCFCRQMANTKLLKGNRLLANALLIYSFTFTLTSVLIN